MIRGEPNRDYKEPNPNPNILSLVFVSYNRIQIVKKCISYQLDTEYWISLFVLKETKFVILTELFV